jgi:hypothetical protein
MLDIILSHWVTYVYVTYVLILVVLAIAYGPRTTSLYWKPRSFRHRPTMIQLGRRIRQSR